MFENVCVHVGSGCMCMYMCVGTNSDESKVKIIAEFLPSQK